MQVTAWQESSNAMIVRKLLFAGSSVLLAGALNVDDFLLACKEQPVLFEVSST